MTRRIFSLLLTAVMLLSLFAGHAAASAEASEALQPAANTPVAERTPLRDEAGDDTSEDINVYFVDETDCADPHVYYWSTDADPDDTEENLIFPGDPLVTEGFEKSHHNYYKVTLNPWNYDRILFNNGIVTEGGANPANQTADLEYIPQLSTDLLDPDGCRFVVYYIYYNNGAMTAAVGTDVWPEDSLVTVPAACDEAGYKAYVGLCTGALEIVETYPAPGHSYGTPSYVWNETAEGWSCTATAVCANDASHVLTETADASYAVSQPPTATEPGLGVWTAVFEDSRFETQTKEVELPATGPVEPQDDDGLVLNRTFTIDIEMRVNFFAKLRSIPQYEEYWIEVTMDGETTTFETDGENPLVFVQSTNRYYAYFSKINATQMGTEISARLYGRDAEGNVFRGPVLTATIAQALLDTMANTGANEKLRILAANMLIYGGEAQRTFAPDTDPVDEGLTTEQAQLLEDLRTKEEPELTQTNSSIPDDSGVTLKTTVSLQSRVELSLTVKYLQNAENVKILVKDDQGNLITTLDTTKSGSAYKATYNEIGTAGIHKQFIFKTQATIDGETVEIGNDLIWSLEGFAKDRENNDAQMFAMCIATLKYCDSIDSYMN